MQGLRGGRERSAAGLLVTDGFGEGVVAVGTLLGQPERVLGAGDLEPQASELALASETLLLRRLNFLARRLELGLCSLRHVAGLGQAALERLDLRARPAVRIPRFPPFLPDDAAAEQVEACRGFIALPGGRGLGANHLQPRRNLRFQVFQPE